VIAALAYDARARTGISAEQINSIRGIVASLQKCWISPSLEGQAGIAFVVCVGFRGNGEALGTPFVSFLTPDVSEDDRQKFRTAVEETFNRCTPLPFSEQFGAGIAGRPITLRFITQRGGKLEI